MILKRILLFWLLTTLLVSTVGYCGDAPPLPSGDHTSSAGSDQNATGNGTDLKGASSVADGPGGGPSQVYQLDAVRVVADKIEAGKTTIGGEELQSMPSRTGSITEALKVVPNVQFSNEETSSLTMGEIRPPRVSIAGAKPYENNFLIDGMSVSNTLNPSGLGKDGDSLSWNRLDVNGADQGIFYDSRLVDSVTVYSSNVPAKYGRFQGGVIDAELVNPRTDRWHAEFTGRHTRSEWFNLRGVDEDSDSSDSQPSFRSNSVFASADGPVADNLALLLAVSKRWSVIPLQFDEDDDTVSEKNQYRYNDNFFVKMQAVPTSDVEVSLDATYAPYSEKRWRPSWDDSGWEIENKAYRIGTSVKRTTHWGTVIGRGAYSQSGFSRDCESNEWYSDLINTTIRGGVGDATTSVQRLDAGLAVELEEVKAGSLTWKISSGVDVTSSKTDMWNEAANATGVSAKSITLNEYSEYDQTKTLNTVGYYVQADIELGRFTLTPGLRLDYDDFSYNADLSPRLKVEFDTFGDGSLRLVTGANRYYGTQLRAYAFDRWRPYFLTRTDRKTGKQTFSTGSERDYQAKGLDTPYSDEVMAGIVGDVALFEYGLELVHRDHRDQLISKTEDGDLYELTNDGESSYDGVTATLSRVVETKGFGKHTLTLGATKSRTKTFDGAFDSDERVMLVSSGHSYDYDRVYYAGELISRSDMPAEDYNAPVVLTLSWLGSFYEDRFRVHSESRWRDSSSGLVLDKRIAAETPYGTTATKPTTPSSQWLNADGDYNDAYRKGVISGGLVTDVSVEWDVWSQDLFTVSLLLDVTNVFDSDLHSGVAEVGVPHEYIGGRGYYAGIRCEF